MSAPVHAVSEGARQALAAALEAVAGEIIGQVVREALPAVTVDGETRHDLPPVFDLSVGVHGAGRTTRQIEAALRGAVAGGRLLYVVRGGRERIHVRRILERLLGDDAGDLLTIGGAALEVDVPTGGVLRVVGISAGAYTARGGNWEVVLDHAALDGVAPDIAAAWRAARDRP